MKQGRFLRSKLIFKSGTEQTPKEFYDRDCDPATGTMTSKHPVVGKAEMAEYRAYTIGIDGHIVGFEALVCADDVEAINGAKCLADGHDIELWSGDRFVTRLIARQLEPSANPAPSADRPLRVPPRPD